MIRNFLRKQKIKDANFFVEPDEIFLDSKNLQNFDRQQFEGRIEKTISKKTILFLGIFFIIFSTVFGTRLGYLQITKGESYFARSENNVLEKVLIFADRGIIYDRNKVELAWNKKVDSAVADVAVSETNSTEQEKPTFPIRAYLSPGFSHLLGYVSYPAQDKSGNFWQSEFIGKDGLEKQYNDRIKGVNGSKIVEMDALKKTHSENIVNVPERGADLVTTVDARIQGELFKQIKNLSDNHSFVGGAGVIMDVENGEVLASTSYPEYSSEILSLGKESGLIQTYITDNRKFFMDRTISGVYTPGSIVKPFVALGALVEGIIDPNKKILSTGSISIPNPYFPDQPSIFKDWKAHGWTDMKQAIAVSSDVYFYSIGGGFEDQKGLGILKIEEYAKLFGIGEETGVDLPDEKKGNIPNPEWKLKNFRGDPWRLGDTFNTSIGQYGFQVTPMEMTRAVGALANYGTLLTPHFILGDEKDFETLGKDIPVQYFDIVHDGMRQAVTYGTAVALNVPYVNAAAKTGTAQVGLAKNKVNSWIVGFFPYEKPKYAFTVMMESGPSTGTVNASSVMRGLFDWMSINTPEYFE